MARWPMNESDYERSGMLSPSVRQTVTSKAETTNPKDLLGAKKVSITKLPFIAVLHGAHAMMDGARKYGPFNWRAKKVVASIYIDAATRHLASWFEGDELASDSGVHHLGHAIACCAILLDAQATGNLVDDRPVVEGSREGFLQVLASLNAAITKKLQELPSADVGNVSSAQTG